MIILDVEQGSPEWNAARVAIPSASKFKDVITSTGNPSKSVTKYCNLLLAEAMAGKKFVSFQSSWMGRGIEMEPEACDLYEFETGNDVRHVGLCYQDEKKLWSCSPDGLIGEDGGLEIKCVSPAVQVEFQLRYLQTGKAPSEHIAQVQGSMFVTGRKWWHFMSYHPDLDPLIIRVERDNDFIMKLNAELFKLVTNFNAKLKQLKGE